MTFEEKVEISGLNHLGLVVNDIEAAKDWFIDKLGFEVLQDRGTILFLAVGNDVLAVKTPAAAVAKPEYGSATDYPQGEMLIRRDTWQSLDHYGFFAPDRAAVDRFAARLQSWGVEIVKGPYDRSDGRSVYFRDPCGNIGEYLYFERPARTSS